MSIHDPFVIIIGFHLLGVGVLLLVIGNNLVAKVLLKVSNVSRKSFIGVKLSKVFCVELHAM